MRVLTVDRLEIDARSAAREGRDETVQSFKLPMGDRHSFADSRALKRFALSQDAEQGLSLKGWLGARKSTREFRQNVVLRIRFGVLLLSRSSSLRRLVILPSTCLLASDLFQGDFVSCACFPRTPRASLPFPGVSSKFLPCSPLQRFPSSEEGRSKQLSSPLPPRCSPFVAVRVPNTFHPSFLVAIAKVCF